MLNQVEKEGDFLLVYLHFQKKLNEQLKGLSFLTCGTVNTCRGNWMAGIVFHAKNSRGFNFQEKGSVCAKYMCTYIHAHTHMWKPEVN